MANKRSSICLLLGFTLMLISCVDSTAPGLVTSPVVYPNPNKDVPLVAFVEFVTDEPAAARLKINGPETGWEIQAGSGFNEFHRVPVIGMKPDSAYSIEISVEDREGNATTVDEELSFTTSPLPDHFPPIEVTVSNPDLMEPGFTMFGATRLPSQDKGQYEVLVIVDSEGDVVWYYEGGPAVGLASPFDSRLFFSIADHSEIVEFSLTGETYRHWNAAKYPNNGEEKVLSPNSNPVDCDTFHHDMEVMPSGNFLVLSTELLNIDDFPSDLSDPDSEKTSATIVSDTVVEFTPEGSIVKEWKLRDILDPGRFGFDSGEGIWDRWGYGNVEGGTKDWIHGNSLDYSKEQQLVIVSLRHADAVVAFSYETGELVWILGTHDGWGQPWQNSLLEPVGELDWQFHQHAARFIGEEKLLLFDNGNFRTWPPEKPGGGELFSRVVEFKINREQKTVEQTWDYRGEEDEVFFSSFVSEADLLPVTGNLLITDGGRTRDEEGKPTQDLDAGTVSARILEITRDEAEKVFEVVVKDNSEEEPARWFIYRADRIPSLQPGLSWAGPK